MNKSTICGWWLQRKVLFKCEPGSKAFHGFYRGSHVKLEGKVADFVMEQCNCLMGISVELICWKARDFAWQMGIPSESFKPSCGWAQKKCSISNDLDSTEDDITWEVDSKKEDTVSEHLTSKNEDQ